MERVLVWVVVVVVVSDLSLALSSHFLSSLFFVSDLFSSLIPTAAETTSLKLLVFLSHGREGLYFFFPGCGFGFVLEMSKVHLAETHGLSTTIGDESCQQRYH